MTCTRSRTVIIRLDATVRALLGGLTLALAAACGGDVAPDVVPASVTLSPATGLTVQSGAVATVRANVTNTAGRPVTASVAWSSSNPDVASVSDGTVTGARVGTATITASVVVTGGASITASTDVTVTPGSPAVLAVRRQPAGGPIGAPLSQQPVVEVHDAAGNIVTSSSATITATIASGGGTLIGQASVSAAAGIAPFSGLSITGPVGDRTLSFSSPGLSPATSAAFAMSAPLTPVIVVDAPSIAAQVALGSSPLSRTVIVTNGGGAPFTSVTIDSTKYATGEPTGWLAASISPSGSAYVITLAANTASLPLGSFHAAVRVLAAGAPNSPLTIDVTVSVVEPYTFTYGGSTDKAPIVDIGASALPEISVRDASGNAVGAVVPTYVSRAPSIATVDASGRITAVSAGQVWVVGTTPLMADSVYVTIPRSTAAPVIRVQRGSYLARAGDTITVTILLDARSTPVGGASIVVGTQTSPFVFTYAAYAVPNETPQPIANVTGTGVLRVAVAAASGISGPFTMVTLQLLSPTPNVGWLTLTPLDVAGTDGADLTSLTTPTRFPLVFR